MTSSKLKTRAGAVVAVATLCAVAGTIGWWSGPLAAASGDLRTGAAAPAAVHAHLLARAQATAQATHH